MNSTAFVFQMGSGPVFRCYSSPLPEAVAAGYPLQPGLLFQLYHFNVAAPVFFDTRCPKGFNYISLKKGI